MVDYKIKVDIDESELTRKFESALKRVFRNYGFPLGGGGGSAGFSSGDQHSRRFVESMKILDKKMELLAKQEANIVKKFDLLKQNTDAIMANKKEIIALRGIFAKTRADERLEYQQFRQEQRKEMQQLRQTGLFGQLGRMIGGNPGGFLGRQMDQRLIKLLGKDESGMPRIPQLVKLAGFAGALAGAAGLSKMIIDSSPLLQAMLKIMNFGTMFMLRPIGDFIALMMRPFVLVMLKSSVWWYKTMGPLLYRLASFLLGEKTGAEGTGLASSISERHEALRDALDGSRISTTFDSIDMTGEKQLTWLDKIWKELNGFWKFLSTPGGQTAAGAMGGTVTNIDPKRYQSVLTKMGLTQTDLGSMQGNLTQSEAKTLEQLQQTRASIAGKVVDPITVTHRQPGRWKSGQGYYTVVTNQAEVDASAKYREYRDEIDKQIQAIQEKAKQREEMMAQLQQLMQYYTLEESLAMMAQGMALGGQMPLATSFGSINMGMGGQNIAFEDYVPPTLTSQTAANMLGGNTGFGIGGISNVTSGGFGVQHMRPEQWTHAAFSKTGTRADAAIAKAEAYAASIQKSIKPFTPSRLGTRTEKTITEKMLRAAGASHRTDLVGKPISTLGKITKFAEGGILNEPVFGFGLNTGKPYTMGERGAEMITPMKKMGTNNTPVNIYFNIDKISSPADLNKIAAYTEDALLRVKSRRGIL